jgi:hypothetical protein
VTEDDEPRADDGPEAGRKLAGASGDDVSAGTSVSGVGGELLKTEAEDVGLRPVAEGGARLGWGRDAVETDLEPAAVNDGTGQSEKSLPPD